MTGRLTSHPPGLIIRLMWSRKSFPLWFIGLFVIAILGHSAPLFVIWGVLAAGYLISAWIHPRVRHTACNGSGERHGFFFPWKFRRCSGCSGGRLVSWGAAHVGTPQAREQARAFRDTRRNTRFWQRW